MEFDSVSVIIPTKNRPTDLRLTLQTLLEQTVLPREVIIVDQSADDKSSVVTQEEFRAARTKHPAIPKLQYICDPSIVGVSAARNRGMELAEGAIWLFLDDDVNMEPDFVKELLHVYSTNKDVGGVSGIITNYSRPRVEYRAWLWFFARGPFRENRLPLYWRAVKVRDSGLFRVTGFTGALMSFRAELARKNRFDIRMRDAEDVDFCLNLNGKPNLVIAPRARLKHMTSPIGRSQDLWLERFALSQAFLYQKNWRRGIWNWICFIWLCIGLCLAAIGSGLRRLSLMPLQATFAGLRLGLKTAKT